MSETIQKRSHPHRITGYLTPGDKSFIKKYVNAHKMSESEALNEAVRLLKKANPALISLK